MSLLDLLALAFAARAALDAWLDEDSVLAERRAATQTWRSEFWRTLANCRFCLSYHVPMWLLLAFYATSLFLPDPWSVVAKLPVYGLAATGLVRVIDWAVKDKAPRPEGGPPESSGAATEDDDEHPDPGVIPFAGSGAPDVP